MNYLIPKNMQRWLLVAAIWFASGASAPLSAADTDESRSSSSVVGVHPLDTLKPGHWYEVPGSEMMAANPCPDVYCPSGNVKNVMAAWSGGTFDTRQERLLVWGGGHSDYAGNEIYAFDIASLQWTRVTDPSIVSGSDDWLYSDGRPRAFHTHAYIEYIPELNWFVSFGGVAPYPSSGGTRRTFFFDLSAGQWDTKFVPDRPDGGSPRGSNAVYDSKTGDVWLQTAQTGSRMFRYDVSANKWTSHAKYSMKLYGVAAIDPERRLFVTVGRQIVAWDLANPDAPAFVPKTSGDNTLESRQGPGFVFDTAADLFVGWDDGGSVYTLNPDTWEWKKIAPAPENSVTPDEAPSAGTFGRFQYIESRNAYVLVNNVTGKVYFYRLSDGVGAGVVKPNAPESLNVL